PEVYVARAVGKVNEREVRRLRDVAVEREEPAETLDQRGKRVNPRVLHRAPAGLAVPAGAAAHEDDAELGAVALAHEDRVGRAVAAVGSRDDVTFPAALGGLGGRNTKKHAK